MRAITASALAAELPETARDNVLLLVSELVTNAFRHAGGTAELELAVSNATVRVEVTDKSPNPPRLSRSAGTLTDESGRGLFLVEALADRWGHEPLERGKRVWFELDLPPDEGALVEG